MNIKNTIMLNLRFSDKVFQPKKMVDFKSNSLRTKSIY